MALFFIQKVDLEYFGFEFPFKYLLIVISMPSLAYSILEKTCMNCFVCEDTLVPLIYIIRFRYLITFLFFVYILMSCTI